MTQLIRYIASNHALGTAIVIGAALIIAVIAYRKLEKQY